MYNSGITAKTAKLVLKICFDTGKMPSEVVEENGWWQINDFDVISEHVWNALNDNPKMLEKYRAGNKNVHGAFVGAIFKNENSHTFNMEIVNNILEWMLDYDGFEFFNSHKSSV